MASRPTGAGQSHKTLTVLLQFLRVLCVRAMALLPAGAEWRRPKAKGYGCLCAGDPGAHREGEGMGVGTPGWRSYPRSLGRG